MLPLTCRLMIVLMIVGNVEVRRWRDCYAGEILFCEAATWVLRFFFVETVGKLAIFLGGICGIIRDVFDKRVMQCEDFYRWRYKRGGSTAGA